MGVMGTPGQPGSPGPAGTPGLPGEKGRGLTDPTTRVSFLSFSGIISRHAVDFVAFQEADEEV